VSGCRGTGGGGRSQGWRGWGVKWWTGAQRWGGDAPGRRGCGCGKRGGGARAGREGARRPRPHPTPPPHAPIPRCPPAQRAPPCWFPPIPPRPPPPQRCRAAGGKHRRYRGVAWHPVLHRQAECHVAHGWVPRGQALRDDVVCQVSGSVFGSQPLGRLTVLGGPDTSRYGHAGGTVDDARVCVKGRPADTPGPPRRFERPSRCSVTDSKATDGVLIHTCDTNHGQSGSAMVRARGARTGCCWCWHACVLLSGALAPASCPAPTGGARLQPSRLPPPWHPSNLCPSCPPPRPRAVDVLQRQQEELRRPLHPRGAPRRGRRGQRQPGGADRQGPLHLNHLLG
jgi:hypothetical protein